MRPRMVIEHRDALVYMLRQAAELEHGICCQYLFAAFSLKQSADEGLTQRQVALVGGWRWVLLGIAAQEMLHLAAVNNLLSAIGAAPWVGRPNLPAQGRHYPPGVQLALLPFGERALRHFLYLERPEGINLADAEGFASLEEAAPVVNPDDVVPVPQDFVTVSGLYRSIEEGFVRLVERYGEAWVFIGDERSQARPETFRWPELVPVTDLSSARHAIDVIVEQGEGPRGHWRDAHYGRLLVVLGEYLTVRREDPSFEPARPVIAATVRPLPDSVPGPLVSDPLTAGVLDGFNVAYEVLLLLLARYFAHGHETDAQLEVLADAAVTVMILVIRPLGEALTTMPVGAEHPGATTGPSFDVFYRGGYVLPHTWQAWVVIHERIGELTAHLRAVGAPLPDAPAAAVTRAVVALDRCTAKLEHAMPRLRDRPRPSEDKAQQ